MAYCLNPECPHKKKIGRPAEFREGITHCSDCGSLLSEEVIEKEDTQTTSSRTIPIGLYKRILYTIAFVLLWRVLSLIPVPGINFHALGIFFNDEGALGMLLGYAHILERVSVCGLAFIPYLNAFVIVEILSLFIQPLKSWRKEGYPGRIKIREVALFTTFLFAFFHGYMLAQGFEGMLAPVGEKIVRNPGLSFRLISALTLTAGTFLTIWIAELITRKGIGHGISLLILAGFGQDIFSQLSQILLLCYQGSPLWHLLMIGTILIVLMALILYMEKGYRRIFVKYENGIETYFPLKFTSAGIIPAIGGEWLIGLPITILGFTAMMGYQVSQELSEALIRGSIWYYMAYAILIIFFYYLLVSFFYNPKDMVTFLKTKNASILFPLGKNEERYIDRCLEVMIPVGALYLCLIVFVPQVISRLSGFYLDGVTLIITVAILLDLIEEMNIRRKGSNLVKTAELHDVPMAGLLKSLFEQKGLPCYLRGYYHRALLYFFGPYIEISVLVPEDRVLEASEVIENYLDANMLTVHFQ
jgi:preprotein translocase subunit SecY